MPTHKWFAESLRLTVFTSSITMPTDSRNWWKQVAGKTHEESTTTEKLGVQSWKGGFQGGNLLLQLQPGRIDWVLLPVFKIDEPGLAPFPVLNYYDVALKNFSNDLEGWLKGIGGIRRIACGSTAVYPAGSKEEAYDILSDYVHMKLDGKNSGDFFYQINRPRLVKKGVKANRLSKWTALDVSAQFTNQGDDTVSSKQLGIICKAELDINTISGAEASVRNWNDIYNTFKKWSREILEKGDTK